MSHTQKFNNWGYFLYNWLRIDASKLKWDSYVDDIHTGGSQSDVNRMMGTEDVKSGNIQEQYQDYLIMLGVP